MHCDHCVNINGEHFQNELIGGNTFATLYIQKWGKCVHAGIKCLDNHVACQLLTSVAKILYGRFGHSDQLNITPHGVIGHDLSRAIQRTYYFKMHGCLFAHKQVCGVKTCFY